MTKRNVTSNEGRKWNKENQTMKWMDEKKAIEWNEGNNEQRRKEQTGLKEASKQGEQRKGSE
jgi:hypothetical protein